MKVISVDEENNIWFATSLKSDKVAEFAENPRAGIACSNEEMSVSLQGKISIVEEREQKKRMWNEGMRIYFPDGIESKDYCLLKFVPEMLRAVTVDEIHRYEIKTIVLLKK
jgi:general stress protein 26